MKKDVRQLLKRTLAMLLVLCMVGGLMPFGVLAEEATQGTTVPVETTASETVAETTAGETVPATTAEETVPETTAGETVPQETVTDETVPETTQTLYLNTTLAEGLVDTLSTGEEPLAVVWSGSDLQYGGGYETYREMTDANIPLVRELIDAVQTAGYTSIDEALFPGDLTAKSGKDASDYGAAALVELLTEEWGLTADEVMLTTGNHDSAGFTLNDATGGYDRENYSVYNINYVNFPINGSKAVVQATADALETWLDAKAEAGYAKPIFVLQHLPLHHNGRYDNYNASYIVDVLNAAGEKGLNIIFLFGHNHSGGYDRYVGGSCIYYAPGDTMLVSQVDGTVSDFDEVTLNFTYMNAGYVGYASTGESGATLSSCVYEIYGDRVEITRYNSTGTCNLKNAGANSSTYDAKDADGNYLWSPDTSVVSSPKTLNMSDIVLGVNESGTTLDETLPKGKTAKVAITVGQCESYSVEWKSYDTSIATISGSGTTATITGVEYGTTTVQATVTANTAARTAGVPATIQFSVTVAPDDATQVNGGEPYTLYAPVDNLYDSFDASARYMFLSANQLGSAKSFGGADDAGGRGSNPASYVKTTKVFNFAPLGSGLFTASADGYDTWKFEEDTKYSNGYGLKLSEVAHYVGTNSNLVPGINSDTYACNMRITSSMYYSGGTVMFTLEDNVSNPLVTNKAYKYGSDLTTYDLTGYSLSYNAANGYFQLAESGDPIYVFKEAATLTDVWMWVEGEGAVAQNGTGETGATLYIMIDGEVSSIPVTTDMISGASTEIPGEQICTVSYAGVTVTDSFALNVTTESGEVVETFTILKNDGNLWKLTHQVTGNFTEGKQYIFANSNTAGNAYAIGAVGSDVTAHEVEIFTLIINGEEGMYIDSNYYDGAIHTGTAPHIWEIEKSGTSSYNYLKNLSTGQYLTIGSALTGTAYYDMVMSATADGVTHWHASSDNSSALRSREVTPTEHIFVYDGNDSFHAVPNTKTGRVWYYVQDTTLDRVVGYVDGKSGTAAAGTSGTVETGGKIVIYTLLTDGTTEKNEIPITSSMLNVDIGAETFSGVHTCTVTYNGVELCDDYVLTLTGNPAPASELVTLLDTTNGAYYKHWDTYERELPSGHYTAAVFMENGHSGSGIGQIMTLDASGNLVAQEINVVEMTINGVTSLYVQPAQNQTWYHNKTINGVTNTEDPFWQSVSDRTKFLALDENNGLIVTDQTTAAASNGQWRNSGTNLNLISQNAMTPIPDGNGGWTTTGRNENIRTHIYYAVDLHKVVAYVDQAYGTVEAGATGTLTPGGNVVVFTYSDEHTYTTEVIPITMDMLGVTAEMLLTPGEYTVPVTYNGKVLLENYVLTVTGETKTMQSVSDTTAAMLTDYVASVPAGSGGNTLLQDQILIYSIGEDGVVTLESVELTLGMLQTTSDQLNTVGVYDGLSVRYDNFVIESCYQLTVYATAKDDTPDFPDEGAVKIEKWADTSNYDYFGTGTAQLNLSVTGIPSRSKANAVIVVDASSSMRICVHGASQDSNATCSVTGLPACDGYIREDTDSDGTLSDNLDDITGTLEEGQYCPTREKILEDALVKMLQDFAAEDEDGYVPDVDIAIAYFNAYTPINSEYNIDKIFNYGDASKVILPFTNSADITDTVLETVRNGYQTESGTNYDRAMKWAYDLLTEKQLADYQEYLDSGETDSFEPRQDFVIFMSDGQPYQYNYFTGGSYKWTKWYNGTIDESLGEGESYADAGFVAEEYLDVFKAYYNEDGKMWMAEAIKGDRTEKYKIIDPESEAEYHIENVNGLNATMMTIGFNLGSDGNSHDVMRRIATSEDYYTACETAEDIEAAFGAFATLVRSANNAVFQDQMSEPFNLQMKTTYDTGVDGETVTLDPGPTIQLKRYETWKHSEEGNTYTKADGSTGTVTADMVGTRKSETATVLETVIFNADGTAAYSTHVDLNGNGTCGAVQNADGTYTIADAEDNILIDGVICAANFWYNTSLTDAATITANGMKVTLQKESFYWNVGAVTEDELVLSFYVYLTESMEGDREGGSYNTNTEARLDYTNYLGNPCTQTFPSPVLPWKQATVGFGFYLVDDDGNPIINQTTGKTGSFEQAIRLTSVTYKDILLNSEDGVSNELVIEAFSNLPENAYTLFDPTAAYQITITSTGEGSWKVTTGRDKLTTYVTQYSNTETSTTRLTESGDQYSYTNTVVWFAVKANVQLVPDTVVIDYGLSVDIDVLGNDLMIGTNGTLNFIGKTEPAGRIPVDGSNQSVESGYARTLDLDYGTAAIRNSQVRYTTDTMQMNDAEVFYYAVNYTGTYAATGYYYSTVTVIPATTIYYEDNFVEYAVYNRDANFSLNTDPERQWKPDGTTINATQDEDRPGSFSLTEVDADNIYGYDGAYATCSAYSMGSAMKITLDSGSNTFGEAVFTFYGTGFDVISLSGSRSGTMTVDVYKSEDFINADGSYNYSAPVQRSYVVDTYYGYTYGDQDGDGDKEWYADTSASDTLYQVPVMEVSGLDYDRYTAVISVSYSSIFDHQNEGSYDFYLDAIRIYDPANDGAYNQVIENAYVADNEGWPSYYELRNMLINANTFASADEEAVTEGVIFIDGNAALTDSNASHENPLTGKANAISDYANFGPNNELYLAPGQAVVFDLDMTGDVAAVHLAMKSAGGTAKAKVWDASINTIENVGATELNTATDRYYDITGLNGKTVVIYNAGTDGILSITNIKVTYKTNPAEGEAEPAASFSIRRSTANLALASLSVEPVSDDTTDNTDPTVPEETTPETTVPEETVPETTVPEETTPETTVPEETEPEQTTPEEPEVFQPGKLQVRVSDSSVKVGSTITVTVTTSADVEALVINGQMVTDYTANRRTGERTWRVRLTAQTVGEMEIAVTACDAQGLTSESVVKTVTVTSNYTSIGDWLKDLLIGLIGGWLKP